MDTIAALNDRFRKSDANDPEGLALGAKVIPFPLCLIGAQKLVAITERVEAFDGFNANDHEHNFGRFFHEGREVHWRITYRDREADARGEHRASDDPADPVRTLRILTIYWANKYG
jgi:hypothetical protein